MFQPDSEAQSSSNLMGIGVIPGETQRLRFQVHNSSHLVAWLGVSGSVPLLPPHAFVTWAIKTLPSTFV